MSCWSAVQLVVSMGGINVIVAVRVWVNVSTMRWFTGERGSVYGIWYALLAC